jgi:pyrroline-5-carboxylate reductase
VLVNDISESRLKFLRDKYGVKTTLDVNATVKDAEMVILACKPQHLSQIASSITTPVTGNHIAVLLISVLQSPSQSRA